jgi:hypothetical protein
MNPNLFMERIMKYLAQSRTFMMSACMVLLSSIIHAEELAVPVGRVTVAGKVARFHFFGRTAESLLHQLEKDADFEGLRCLKKRKTDAKLEKIIEEKIYPVECWLSVSLKKRKLVEVDDESGEICRDAVFYRPHSDSIEWDEQGNRRPRAPDYIDYEDIRNGDALPVRFSEMFFSATSPVLPESEKNRGYDLMAAKIEGSLSIADRKAQFLLIGQTAEAMYYQHAEDKNSGGMGCIMMSTNNSEQKDKNSQFRCWMNIDLKNGRIVESNK